VREEAREILFIEKELFATNI